MEDRSSAIAHCPGPGDTVAARRLAILDPRFSILGFRPRGRSGRTMIAVLCFLLLFAILIVLVSQWYLLPTLNAFKTAGKAEKNEIAIYARLLLAVLLVILLIGLMLTFRIGRFFFPRKSEPPVRTKYVDAWAEAGKRASEDGNEDNEEADEQ
jgi:hypothetical protein